MEKILEEIQASELPPSEKLQLHGRIEQLLKKTINENIKKVINELSAALSANRPRQIYQISQKIRRLIVGNLNNTSDQDEVESYNWVEEVNKCKSIGDFLELFSKNNLTEEEWKNTAKLKDLGYEALARNISRKFDGWKKFLQFMGKEIKKSPLELMEGRITKKHFVNMFAEINLKNKEWASSEYLQSAGYGVLQSLISKKFGSWQKFLEFMGEQKWAKKIIACKKPEELIKLLKKAGFNEAQYLNSGWLVREGYTNLRSALQSHFGSWNAYKKFLGAKEKESWNNKISKFRIPEDFRNFLEKELNLSEPQWSSASWLQENDLHGLQSTIRKRFNDWKIFQSFMGLKIFDSWPKKISSCKSESDFLLIFKQENITAEQWNSTGWLMKNGYQGLYDAIRKKFKSWGDFLKFMGVEDNEQKNADLEFDITSNLKLEEAIALLHNDPLKLKRYIQFSHPELSVDEIDKLVIRSFKGLKDSAVISNQDIYLEWLEELPAPALDKKLESKTEENTITISGNTNGASHIFVSGAYTRRKKVEVNGKFTITIPLKTGEENEIYLMSLDTKTETRSMQRIFTVEQTSEADDVEALIDLLSELGEKVHKDIQKNPGRLMYLKQCMEQSLIKKFGLRFSDGESYIEKIIKKETISPTMKKVLHYVLSKFRKINDTEIPGVIEGSHLFFQKYCVVDIRRRISENMQGVILANDPGTGKTRIVQGATADMHTTVITPNSVVPAWEEEAGKVLEDANITVLHGEHSSIRKKRLETVQKMKHTIDTPQHIYTNRDFLRNTEDEERFTLLSDKETIVVEDEAHSRHNEDSEQTKGVKKLEAAFRILVTATPSKNPETFRKMMAIMKPEDKRFSSPAAFAKAFPIHDPQALKTLNLIKEEVTLRFRKEDVMETVDPTKSLSQQKHKLPVKNFLPEENGAFTMDISQAESIYQMFINWDKWTRKNNKYIPDNDIARNDNLRTSNGFAKRHAMRQIINNPSYIHSSAKDAKMIKMEANVQSLLKEGRKVIIFCAYEAQAQKYAEAFAKYKPAIYTGQTSKKKDVLCRKESTDQSRSEWILDGRNYPIQDPTGEPMSALEYERITFQNADDRKIMIATYDAGAVGTTFTAGKAMILDDSAGDCIVEIQAEDRAHRIDPQRLTHADVKYVKIQSRYPEKFLEATKKRWLVKENGHYKEFSSYETAKTFASKNDADVLNAYVHFFAQGTYDQVHSKNLRTQRVIFHLINDGIADDSLLNEGQREFKGL